MFFLGCCLKTVVKTSLQIVSKRRYRYRYNRNLTEKLWYHEGNFFVTSGTRFNLSTYPTYHTRASNSFCEIFSKTETKPTTTQIARRSPYAVKAEASFSHNLRMFAHCTVLTNLPTHGPLLPLPTHSYPLLCHNRSIYSKTQVVSNVLWHIQ